MARLSSLNVGPPRDITWNGKTVRTAIWKSPVEGRRMVHISSRATGAARTGECACLLFAAKRRCRS